MNYLLRTHASHFRTGIAPDDRQALLGVLLPNLIVCLFDAEGVFLESRTIPLTTPPPRVNPVYRYTREYETAAARQMDALAGELQLSPQPISVQAFYDETGPIGIADLPSDFEEYLEDPEAFPEDDPELFDEEIRRWRAEGQFVFYLGCGYWMSRDGYVVHTD